MLALGRVVPPNLSSRVDFGPLLGFALAALVFLGVGAMTGHNPIYGGGAAALVLMVGIVATDLSALPVLAIPCTLFLIRAGGAGTGLSLSDFVLFAATICALLVLRTAESPELRSLLWIVVFYQAALIPTLLLNPYRANVVEWVHEAVLVGGGLVVGWAVGRNGRAHLSLSLYALGCCIIAVWAAGLAPTKGFQPVYLPYLHKNVIGDMLAIAAVMLYARPDWVGWGRRWSMVGVLTCAVGILASQSKQGMISCAVGIFVVALRGAQIGRRSKLVILAMVPLVVVAYVVARDQLSSGNRFNAINQRLTWFDQSVSIWEHARWFGVGLRWWYTSRLGVNFQPPNAEFEMLTSAGVLGVAALLIMTGSAVWILLRLSPRFGTLAFAVVLVRFVQGQFDLYWVASQSSIPWMVVGVCLGALALERSRQNGLAGADASLAEQPSELLHRTVDIGQH